MQRHSSLSSTSVADKAYEQFVEQSALTNAGIAGSVRELAIATDRVTKRNDKFGSENSKVERVDAAFAASFSISGKELSERRSDRRKR